MRLFFFFSFLMRLFRHQKLSLTRRIKENLFCFAAPFHLSTSSLARGEKTKKVSRGGSDLSSKGLFETFSPWIFYTNIPDCFCFFGRCSLCRLRRVEISKLKIKPLMREKKGKTVSAIVRKEWIRFWSNIRH